MAKRRLNKNVVGALTLCALGAMVVAALVYLNSLHHRDPKYFVALAEAAAARSDWKEAALFYAEAFERGRDSTYLVHLGQMQLNDGDVPRALGAWEQALVNQPDLVEAHLSRLTLLLELARLNGRTNEWRQVRDVSEAMLASSSALSAEHQAFARHANGLALVHLRGEGASNAPNGLAQLKQAAETSPETVDYPLDYAAQLFLHDRAGEGELVFDQLLKKHTAPGSAASKVRLAYAQFLMGQDKLTEAERFARESVQLADADREARKNATLALAAILAQKWSRSARDDSEKDSADAAYTEAESVLRNLVSEAPDDYDAYVQLAILYKAAQKPNEELAICESRLSRGLVRRGVEGTRNRVNAFRLMIYASEACVAQAITALQSGDTALQQSLLARAQQFVDDAKGEFSTHPRALSQAGRVAIARGNYGVAVANLRAAEEGYRAFDAIDWENKIILAQVHLQLGESGAARSVLEEGLEQARTARAKDPTFWIAYAQTLFHTDEFDRALSYVDRVLLLDPGNTEALQLKAAVYERQGKRAEAGRIMQDLTGDAVVRALLAARQASLDGNPQGAVEMLKEALASSPKDVRIVTALVGELNGLNRAEEARKIIADARVQQPNDPQLRRLAISVQPDLTPEQRDAAMLEAAQQEPDAYKRALDLIAYYSRKSEPAKSLGFLTEAERHLLAKDSPVSRNATTTQHRALLRAKLQLAAQLKDETALAEARDSAAKHDVDGAKGRSIAGLYHMARQELDLAVAAFNEVLQAQPTDSWTLGHLGQCMQMLGRVDEAQSAYERALASNPDEPSAHRGLASLAKARGETEAYQKHLEVCEKSIPDDPWVQGELLARKEQADPAAAIARREALLAANPDDLANLARLVALCETSGATEKGDSYLQRILAAKPDDKDVVASACAYFRRTKRPERSLDVAERFASGRSTKEERADAKILTAEHHLALKNLEAAEKTLLAAADEAVTLAVSERLATFYLLAAAQPKKALPWLNQAIDVAKAANSPRRAQLLLTRVSANLNRAVDDLAAANRDLAELATAFPEDPRRLLWQSEVFARTGQITQAVSVLTEYLAQRPKDPFALFQRAQQYVAQGQTGAAIQDLEVIKKIDPLALDLEPRILLAMMQLRSGKRDLWLQELQAIVHDAPDSPRALEELVNAYIREKRPADADRIVAAQLNRRSGPDAARWYFLRARISTGVGDSEKALGDLERAAELTAYAPEAMVAVLDAYAQLNRFAEGVSYFEQHATSDAKHAVLRSRYGMMLMRVGQKARAVEQFRQSMALAVAENSEATRIIPADLRRALPEANGIEEAITLFEANPPTGVLGRANDRILVRLYRRADRIPDATAKLRSLIQSALDDQEKAALWQELGEVQHVAGDFAASRAAYEESLRFDPDNWVTLNNLAYLLSDRLQENRLALPYAQRAVANIESSPVLDTLGWIYVGLGDHAQAIAELSRAVRLDPNATVSLYHLGEAYRRSGQFSQATDVLQTGRTLARNNNEPTLLEQIDDSLKKVRGNSTSP